MQVNTITYMISKALSEPSPTSKLGLFAKLLNGFQPLIIFAKSSILYVLLGHEHSCDIDKNNTLTGVFRVHQYAPTGNKYAQKN